MAWLAADALAARLTGRKVPETTIGYTIQCISLGRRDGIIQRVTPDDQAMSTVIKGRTAARIKELRERGLEHLPPDRDAAEPPPPPRGNRRSGNPLRHPVTRPLRPNATAKRSPKPPVRVTRTGDPDGTPCRNRDAAPLG
ncbi:hypothetical protein [Nonomuraea basaltis]|uniref:hypothetical protein n=1 Tax=Nonomuraea basaltis TaxID=2495887 RepID=UPI00198025ED|nr:hypothetical protein [Nonomuraea basaltis]